VAADREAADPDAGARVDADGVDADREAGDRDRQRSVGWSATSGRRQRRGVTTSLALGVGMLLAGCDLEPPPAAPSLAEQGVGTGGDQRADDHAARAASADIDEVGSPRGDLHLRPTSPLELADGLTVAVVAIEGGDQVRLEVDGQDGAAAFELTVGEVAEVGEHTVELVEVTDVGAIVVVTDAAGAPIGPA
jgi:hypothetical protein